MLTELIAILFFLLFSWIFILGSHMAAANMKGDPDAPAACSGVVAIILTIIAAIIF